MIISGCWNHNHVRKKITDAILKEKVKFQKFGMTYNSRQETFLNVMEILFQKNSKNLNFNITMWSLNEQVLLQAKTSYTKALSC